ncbi:GntR family transcriptional regulator [Mycolicibacterium sp.]|uniref:GntR family transcriptional regulator n=1 Tax=Mycolicibacterium sp. TaxID=2320850 RepID=UPI003D10A153
MTAADAIRTMIVDGSLKPGDRLSEVSLAADLDVSRNTLREAFRLLTNEGLVTHVVNRGVQVSELSMANVVDLYRVRRLIEVNILRDAVVRHPAGRAMRSAVDRAFLAREEDNWVEVALANLEFHRSVVALADSPHLNKLFGTLEAEMRLAFALFEDPEFLHSPYIELNDEIITAFERSEPERAAEMLDDYLLRSERLVLAAYVRRH